LVSDTIALAAGSSHTCALTEAGGLHCWGDNAHGQLGDGTSEDRSTPVRVSGLERGVIALTAGGWHTCALTEDGGVHCWGWNGRGQLGDGTTEDRSTPVTVSGLQSGVTAITAGGSYTCALTDAGAVRCWGNNEDGQLGDGTTENRTTPVRVSGLDSDIIALAAGESHTCALAEDGGVHCWGWNWDGQLGDGTAGSHSAVPVQVALQAPIRQPHGASTPIVYLPLIGR
jgi:alpha-tubulin suppressor-like RCC1 family protein